MPRMHRRTFLLSTALAAATLGTGIAIAVSNNDPEMAIGAVLAKYFPDTAFDGEDLASFVEDFAARHGQLLDRQPTGLLDRFGAGGSVARFENVVVREFLLATDYYQQDSTPPVRVSFIRSADPYTSGCANPLARLG